MTIQFLKLSKDKILTASVVSMVVVFTFVTTGMTAVKIAKSSADISQSNNNLTSVVSQSKTNKKNGFWDLIQQKLNLEDKYSNDEDQNEDLSGLDTNTSNSNLNLTAATPIPTAQTSISQSTNSNQCIVTVFGRQYDVTNLVKTHSGGNIFNCGTDMSSIYQGKHGSNISVIQPYLYITSSSNTNTGSTIPTAAPTPTPSTTTNSNLCIVTVFGKQYNVTTLKQTHSGGNIFNCGTDMSSTYQGKHGSNVSLIQRYLYNSTVTPPSGQTTPQPTSTPRSQHQDDDDDD